MNWNCQLVGSKMEVNQFYTKMAKNAVQSTPEQNTVFAEKKAENNTVIDKYTGENLRKLSQFGNSCKFL